MTYSFCELFRIRNVYKLTYIIPCIPILFFIILYVFLHFCKSKNITSAEIIIIDFLCVVLGLSIFTTICCLIWVLIGKQGYAYIKYQFRRAMIFKKGKLLTFNNIKETIFVEGEDCFELIFNDVMVYSYDFNTHIISDERIYDIVKNMKFSQKIYADVVDSNWTKNTVVHYVTHEEKRIKTKTYNVAVKIRIEKSENNEKIIIKNKLKHGL